MQTEVKFWLICVFIIGLMVFGCTNSDDDGANRRAEQEIAQRLQKAGVTLFTPSPPVANYVHAVRTGNLIFLAGHGPRRADGSLVQGKVGRDLSLEEGRQAARLTAIALLSSLKEEIGDLNRVRRIVRVFGMVNATEDFVDHPQVINGCSDLFVEIFGESGKHARAAVGMASLPMNIPVEIEMVVEVDQ